MKIVSMEGFVATLSALPAWPRVVVSGNFATPRTALAALDGAVAQYRLFALNAQSGFPDRDDVILESPFVGPGMRHSARLEYIPARLSLVPRLFATALPPDVVLLHTTIPRADEISLGTEVNVLPAALEAVKGNGGLVLAQLNPRMPWTGGDGVLATGMVDLAIEVDEPLETHISGALDDDSLVIGERVASQVSDGATLQLGIGSVPDATLAGLARRRDLHVWSEMFSDGVLALEEAGALDQGVPLVASFLFGSERLYSWADRNPRVRMLRTETTNSPSLISQNPLMVSVNTALQVDLFAQANASRVRSRVYSGFGGQTDFTVGALQARHGQAFIALRSWHPKADCSTIIPLVDEPVTSFQHTAVVTEQGVAEIWGRDQKRQAANLIEIAAHPRVREELWEEAGELGLT